MVSEHKRIEQGKMGNLGLFGETFCVVPREIKDIIIEWIGHVIRLKWSGLSSK